MSGLKFTNLLNPNQNPGLNNLWGGGFKFYMEWQAFVFTIYA